MLMLTIVRDTYSRTESGKGWRAQPYRIETETMPWHHRDACTTEHTTQRWGERMHHYLTEDDTLRFFRRLGGSEYAERSYTPAGYVVTRLISTNPGRTVRLIRTFRFTDVPS